MEKIYKKKYYVKSKPYRFLILYQMFNNSIKLFLSLFLYFVKRKIALQKLKVQLLGQIRKLQGIMKGNATNELNYYKINERNNP